MAENNTISLREDKELLELGLNAIRSPQKAFKGDVELSLSLQFLFIISVITGVVFPLASLMQTGTTAPASISVLFVNLALSLFEFLLIIPTFVLLETALLYFPMKAVFGTGFREVFSVMAVSSATIPFTVFSILLPRPYTMVALIPGLYMIYIQARGLSETA